MLSVKAEKALSVVNSVPHVSSKEKKKGTLPIVPVQLAEIVFQ